MIHWTSHAAFGLLWGLLITGATIAATHDASANKDAKAPPFQQKIDAQTQEIFAKLEAGKRHDAMQQANQLFDSVIAYVPDSDVQLYTQAAYIRRLTDLLRSADNEAILKRILALVRENPQLGKTLAFMFDPKHDDARRVLDIVDQIAEQRPDQIADYTQLTVALAVVHDHPEPFIRRINENTAQSPEPLALFDYYVSNERRLNFGIQDVPAELLIYVVDTTASIEEMRWALSKYAGDRAVGKRFFDIDYDYDHLQAGTVKDITEKGFTLPNIARYGGVCADQAYYAMTVGKAIGVPTVYTVGRSADVGHAWTGFLQARGRQAAWNFEYGRYEVYQGVRGMVLNPQTLGEISDSEVGLLAEMIGSSNEDRWEAAALTDAAERLRQAGEHGWDPKPIAGISEPASTGVDRQLQLLREAQERFLGYAPAWMLVGAIADAGDLSYERKKQLADIAVQAFGRNYPDFMVACVSPMIRSVPDPEQQNELWEKLFRMVERSRKDLAAEVRLQQAALWDKAGDDSKAGRCYEDIVSRFANDGPFVLEALQKVENKLVDVGREKLITQLYERTWKSIRPPSRMAPAFAMQSNWYNVGQMYEQALRAEGQDRQADRVKKKINRRLGLQDS